MIEAVEAADAPESPVHARLCVERRVDPLRRDGHEPPVVAEAQGASTAQVLEQLYPIAADNVAVAQQILQWQARRRRPS